MDYAEEIRKIQREYPLDHVFENPMDCAFLIRTEDGMESAESMMKNIKTVQSYKTRRYEQYLENERGKDKYPDEKDISIPAMDFTVVKDNGYTFHFKPNHLFNDWDDRKMFVYKVLKRAAGNGCSLSKGYIERMEEPTDWHADFVLRAVCFTHSFAKAFCKNLEPLPVPYRSPLDKQPKFYHEWEIFLQQMVLETSPIDYLRKFIEDGKE